MADLTRSGQTAAAGVGRLERLVMQSQVEVADAEQPPRLPGTRLLRRIEGGRLAHAALQTQRPAAVEGNRIHVPATAPQRH